ncbi:membrane protein insertion efficiency factor YidD [Candidatus Woesearchaeota archaeon]|nr:membrane protein insertion efficiency factor YidD [Candidatus Woesearchaeota archaeon]
MTINTNTINYQRFNLDLLKRVSQKTNSGLEKLLLNLIEGYRENISPALKTACSNEISCSEYAVQLIKSSSKPLYALVEALWGKTGTINCSKEPVRDVDSMVQILEDRSFAKTAEIALKGLNPFNNAHKWKNAVKSAIQVYQYNRGMNRRNFLVCVVSALGGFLVMGNSDCPEKETEDDGDSSVVTPSTSEVYLAPGATTWYDHAGNHIAVNGNIDLAGAGALAFIAESASYIPTSATPVIALESIGAYAAGATVGWLIYDLSLHGLNYFLDTVEQRPSSLENLRLRLGEIPVKYLDPATGNVTDTYVWTSDAAGAAEGAESSTSSDSTRFRDPEETYIAIVDDNPDFSETRAEFLGFLNIPSGQIHTYERCSDLLTKIQSGYKYDLVITDTNLHPDDTPNHGYLCAQQVKALSPDTVVVGMSAVSLADEQKIQELTRNYQQSGAETFVSAAESPLVVNDLVKQILNLP